MAKKIDHERSEVIASGKVVDIKDKEAGKELVVTATIAVEKAREESGDDIHVAYLNVKHYTAAELPVTAISFAEIAQMVEDAGGEMKVPSVEDETEMVELEAPTAVRYAKTKAFHTKDEDGNDTVCVLATLRYEW